MSDPKMIVIAMTVSTRLKPRSSSCSRAWMRTNRLGFLMGRLESPLRQESAVRPTGLRARGPRELPAAGAFGDRVHCREGGPAATQRGGVGGDLRHAEELPAQGLPDQEEVLTRVDLDRDVPRRRQAAVDPIEA